jgi:dolichyl-phosphate-mannose-protein mannosyltransferase
MFAIAAVVRLVLDTGRGYKGDVDSYLALTWKTVNYGIHSAYVGLNGVPPYDNPPVLLYPFWLLGWLYQQLISPSFPPTWLSDPQLLRFMLRLPTLGADLLIGALIFRVLQHKSLSFNVSLMAVGAYLFNPAVIFDSAYWGQTAAVHTLFMLIALIAAERRAYVWAGAALTAAVLTKPQALAIAPLICILAARERGWLRISIAGLLTAILIVAPFLMAGNIQGVCAQYLNTVQYHPVLSANAHNLWWFVTAGQGWQSDTPFGSMISSRSAGLLLFGWATLLSSVAIWRWRQTLFLAAAYQSLAFFMLNTQIHENHLLPMFAPLVLVAASDRSAWWLYIAFTFTALANMALHDPNLIGWLGYPEDAIFGGPELAIPRWLNAAAQLALFIAFTLRLIKPFLRESHQHAAPIEAT